MKYADDTDNVENEEDLLQAVPDVPETGPTVKTIQISLDKDTGEPIIVHTNDLDYTQLIGILKVSLETLINLHVVDRLHKKKALAAYNHVK